MNSPVRPPQPQRNLEGPLSFDCFLSHNSKGKPTVRKLAAALRVAGISVWLDEEQLRPGVPWQPLLESGIAASSSVAVLVSADGLGPWEDEEQQAALRLAVRDKRPVIPVLLPDAPQAPELPLFLGNRTWVDLRPGAAPGHIGGIDLLLWGITGRKPGAAVRVDADTAQSPGSELAARPDATLPQATRPPAPINQSRSGHTAEAIRRYAQAEIAHILGLQPALCASFASHWAMQTCTPVDLAIRLCHPQEINAGISALKLALPGALQALRREGRPGTELCRQSLDILGCIVITAVTDDYCREDAPLVEPWFHGRSFEIEIPLGTPHCVETLMACWRRGRAEFTVAKGRVGRGKDNITPTHMQEIGFDDPASPGWERLVNGIRRIAYQHLFGETAPVVLSRAQQGMLCAMLDNLAREERRRLHLVIDRRDLDQVFDLPSAVAALSAALPQIRLIFIHSDKDPDPGVFILPEAQLAAAIHQFLRSIEDCA